MKFLLILAIFSTIILYSEFVRAYKVTGLNAVKYPRPCRYYFTKNDSQGITEPYAWNLCMDFECRDEYNYEYKYFCDPNQLLDCAKGTAKKFDLRLNEINKHPLLNRTNIFVALVRTIDPPENYTTNENYTMQDYTIQDYAREIFANYYFQNASLPDDAEDSDACPTRKEIGALILIKGRSIDSQKLESTIYIRHRPFKYENLIHSFDHLLDPQADDEDVEIQDYLDKLLTTIKERIDLEWKIFLNPSPVPIEESLDDDDVWIPELYEKQTDPFISALITMGLQIFLIVFVASLVFCAFYCRNKGDTLIPKQQPNQQSMMKKQPTVTSIKEIGKKQQPISPMSIKGNDKKQLKK